MNHLTIGKVAKKAGVNIDTIRYYERRHLLEEPARSPAGYRRYLPDTIKRIKFIKRAQELGFSLDEINELLQLKIDSETACDDVKERAEAKVANIQGKIQILQKMQEILSELVVKCELRQPTESCPILESLENETIIVTSTLTCPKCGHIEPNVLMPTDSCQFFYTCKNCQIKLRPKEGDCCVFCSYGEHHCIGKQKSTLSKRHD